MPRRTLLRGAAAGLAGAVGLRAARAGAGQPKRPLCHATGDPASPWVVISVADPAQPGTSPTATTPTSTAAPTPTAPRPRPAAAAAGRRLRRAHHDDHADADHHDHADADARANPVLEPGGLPRRLWVRLCVRETRRGHVLF